MMYGVNDTPNLHFATAAGKIGNGLDEQLKNFVQEHPDTNLIIIDTMQKMVLCQDLVQVKMRNFSPF
jgi:hypothetical protein